MVYGTLIKVIAGLYLGCVGVVTNHIPEISEVQASLRCKVQGYKTHRIDDRRGISLNYFEFRVIKPIEYCSLIQNDELCP